MRYGTILVLKLALIAHTIGQTLTIALAWEVPTHVAISAEATRASSVNQILRESLGFNEGLDTTLRDGTEIREVQLWIEEGSRREDDFGFLALSSRFLNHFHHPLRSPWSQAGLSDGLFTGRSSGIWAQTQNQTTSTGSWSWQETRERFHRALTSPNKADRESFLAQTFRGLGHQIHLIQDASSVPHTRNEAHPPLPLAGFNLEQWGLRFQDTRASDFTAILRQTPIMPDPQLFSLSPESTAPIPISKFLDANQYSGNNPDATTALFSGTTASGQPALLSPFGLSEYTNANFVHRNTIFTDTLPQSHKWWSPYPRLSSTNVLTEIVPEVLTAEDGIADQVVYVRKERDGEQIDHFLKTTFSGIRSSELLGGSTPVSQIFQLDDRVNEDYARLLWPRAVGYSTGLLDYFFRGKLDLDISTDPDDPTLVRVEGKNASSEKLDGGMLELYADDSEGIRSQVVPVGSNTVFAGPGQAISVRYRLPADADKLMAVYKGKLGEEAPQGNFVGGVIGKQLSAQRVEQIFTDFTRWYIRNSQGVFPLPLLKSNVDDLQWGDSDNALVGRSRIGPGQANLFFSYRINRLLGETHLPLTADGNVAIQLVQQFSFPMGIQTGTTIDFFHTLPYRQYVLWENTMSTWDWVPTPTEDNPDAGHYEGSSQTTYGISLLVNQTATASFTAPIILDATTHVFGSWTGYYVWDLWNIHLTSDGRPLALVRVDLTTNNLGSTTFPSRTLGKNGGSIGAHPGAVELPPVQVPFALPEIGAIWMLVDVSTGQALANTAPPTLVAHHETARISYGSNPNQDPPLRAMGAAQFNGGPQAGSIVSASDVTRLRPWETEFCSEERLNLMTVLASQSVTSEHVSNTLTLNRSEIAQIEFPPPPNFPARTINFPISCGGPQDLPQGFRIAVSPDPTFAPNIIEWGLGIVRTAPIAGTEQLVFLMTQAQDNTVHSSRAIIAAWHPALERIENQQEFPGLGLHFLLGASQDIGIAGTFGENSETSRIVDFKANSVVEIPNLDIFDYSLLEPNYLYNMFDFKFHLKDPSLDSTGLPASLAAAPSRNPLGRYHATSISR